MPFKFTAARRDRIRRGRYRVRNWPSYEAGLKRRGDLTLWIDEAALEGWQAPRRNTPGGQAIYSDLAIEMVLMLRMVFHLALRQAEAFAGSVLRLLGLDLCVPDHTTLSRRSGHFARRRPNVTWLDVGQIPGLLEQVEGEIASFIADGAYDGEPVYQAVAGKQHDPPPDVVIPPRASAVLNADAVDPQSQRDRHIQLIAGKGRMGWQRANGYGRHNLVQTPNG